MIRLISCNYCDCRFKVKEYRKPFVGMFKDKPVFHWHFKCPSCDYVHSVRFYNKHVNPYFDKVQSLEFSLIIDRFDPEKVKQLKLEYEIAMAELDRLNSQIEDELTRGIHKIV
jgi:hypothetical protein